MPFGRLVVVTLAFAALPALAQVQEFVSPEDLANEEAKGDTVAVPGPEGTPSSDEPVLPGPPPNFDAAPETYVVQPGDTLWDITQRFLGNAWYWPKVWSFNPEIPNANWIEPGTVIRFRSGGEALPTQLATPEEFAEGEVAPEEVPEELVTGKPKVFRPTTTRILDQGFVTHKELEGAGRIVAAWEEKMLLSTYDRVYVKFDKGAPKLGGRYVVFRTEREIYHPKTGKPVGYLTRLLGQAQIVEVNTKGASTAVIGDVLDTIERGDYLLPWQDSFAKTIVFRENQVELDGVVLASLVPHLAVIGEHHYIFIDKGRKDGVEVGNTFQILRRGDPLVIDRNPDLEAELPWEEIGLAVVVEVRDETSTALVVRSIREVVTGDRAVMRVGGATVASGW
ncbi:MAG: LysM peptidoglycan-binding domain-containing protein [Deltaproteobacteria bacterium]|nr:MAG: LysM peptidoglycan-binding domain-containing protein [Deltaproteobacteria bacterium]